ncbi:MAG TPA: hypothetical protein VL443_16220 [Cyclobacteriaceae bacterium]|nr:hypothetical protein [Cyclobacteriaceae bacterium]
MDWCFLWVKNNINGRVVRSKSEKEKFMKAILAITFIFCFPVFAQSNEVDGWPIFARVKFTPKLFKKSNEYFLVPFFDQRIRSLEGTEIILKGYHIPFDLPKDQLIISKNAYASCFFCGGAGPESVAEVILKSKAPKLKVDQIISVKGKLKLNDKDINHMNFILVDAEIIAN